MCVRCQLSCYTSNNLLHVSHNDMTVWFTHCTVYVSYVLLYWSYAVIVQHMCVSDATPVTYGITEWKDWHDL